MHRFVIAFAAAAVTFFAQPAQASTDPYAGRETRVVHIGDLDLTRPADQEELRVRVEHAARRICANEAPRLERNRCAKETVDYTMNLAPWGIRQAYAAAVDRRESFALAAK